MVFGHDDGNPYEFIWGCSIFFNFYRMFCMSDPFVSIRVFLALLGSIFFVTVSPKCVFLIALPGYTVEVKYIATPKPCEFIGISIIMSKNPMNSYACST